MDDEFAVRLLEAIGEVKAEVSGQAVALEQLANHVAQQNGRVGKAERRLDALELREVQSTAYDAGRAAGHEDLARWWRWLLALARNDYIKWLVALAIAAGGARTL